MKKVCVIVAHADDEILGAGGTMAKHAAAGDEVGVLVMCGRGMRAEDQTAVGPLALEAVGGKGFQSLSHPDQKFDTVSILSLTIDIENFISEHKPEIIYTHSAGDLNMDHRITHKAVLTACRPLPGSSVREIYGMEIASSTEWGYQFYPTHFVDITGIPLEKKLAALECYKAEMREPPHARSVMRVMAMAVCRGGEVGVMHAEAFTTIRRIS